MAADAVEEAALKAQAERDAFIGRPCIYVDPKSVEHSAIINACWSTIEDGIPHSVNLVYVSDQEAKRDQYGRQVEHDTSVVHRSKQGAHGRYFYMPHEALTAG